MYEDSDREVGICGASLFLAPASNAANCIKLAYLCKRIAYSFAYLRISKKFCTFAA